MHQALRLVNTKETKPVPAPPEDPLQLFVGHLTAAIQLLPKVLETRDAATRAATMAELRDVLREDRDRADRAVVARELLELPEWLTSAQVAQVLEVSLSTVRGRLQEERRRPEGERPLSACSRPSSRMRGKHPELEFNRDQILALKEREAKGGAA